MHAYQALTTRAIQHNLDMHRQKKFNMKGNKNSILVHTVLLCDTCSTYRRMLP